MGGINLSRVVIGGLIAGLIINIGEFALNGVILAGQWAALAERFGIGLPGAARLTIGAGITFIYGIVLIWIYAAIRPRFGPGLRSILAAAATFWVIAYVLFLAALWNGGLVTADIALVSILWGAFEVAIAAAAGVWFYREGAGA